MKKPKPRPKLIKIITIILLAIVVVGGLYKLGMFKKDCQQDNECFSEKLQKCSYARYDAIINNNYYEYTIKGEKGDACTLHIKLKQMGPGTPVEQVNLFEGKEMTCYIPEGNLDIDVDNINNLLSYCTGPLKEAIYEHIITKMYGLVLKNINPIIEEIDETIR